jgi:uncharacterized membrane protein
MTARARNLLEVIGFLLIALGFGLAVAVLVCLLVGVAVGMLLVGLAAVLKANEPIATTEVGP